MHRAAPSPRAMPPPRRSARLHRSPSGSGSASPPRSDSPRAPAPTPRKRAKAKMRLSQAEEMQRSRSIEQVIDSSADDSETATISASGSPSPVRRKRVQELEREDQQPDPPAADTDPDIARGRPLLLPFVVGALAIVLGVLSLFSFKYALEEAPPLRLERALPLLTAHVRAVGALLPRAREMQRPALDHLAVRELRDAARLSTANANLDAPADSDSDTPKLADELEALGAQLMAAKMRALDLGVALWLAGRATHNELQFALSSFTSPSSSSFSNTPTSTSTAAVAVASATRFLASSAADLHTLANDTASMLQDAYTFGTTVTASPAFAALVSSVGKTPRSRWLGSGSVVGEELAGLRGSVDRAQEAIRRAGALGRAARDLAGEAEGIGERLRGVFATDDPQHPPKSHADPAQTAKLAAELRAALEALAGQVAQVQPDTG